MSNHLDYEINKELGECYLFMGEFDKAEEYYQKAASSNGIHPDPYLGLATIAVHRGELDAAMTLYSKAANIEPNDKAYAGMGLIQMDREEHDAAFESFLRSLELNPENMIAMTGMIQEAYVVNRIEDALAHLTNALAVNPEQDAVRFSLAGCYISLDRAQEALEQLEIVLENNPEHEEARELYAKISQ